MSLMSTEWVSQMINEIKVGDSIRRNCYLHDLIFDKPDSGCERCILSRGIKCIYLISFREGVIE